MKLKSNPLMARLNVGQVWHLADQRGIALKRYALADACGISRNTMGKMLSREITHISVGPLAALCQALNCLFDDIVVIHPNGDSHESQLVAEPE